AVARRTVLVRQPHRRPCHWWRGSAARHFDGALAAADRCHRVLRLPAYQKRLAGDPRQLGHPALARHRRRSTFHSRTIYWLAIYDGAQRFRAQLAGARTHHRNRRIIFRDRVTALQSGGILMSSLGVLVIITRGQLNNLENFLFNWGDIIIL